MQKILRKLGVESAETKPFLLMVLLSFLIGGGIVFADTSANALFLSEFGADLLPLIYILSAALMVGIGTLYARLDRSLPPRRLVSGMAFLLFTVMLLMRIGLAVSGNRWFIAAALVWYRALFAFGEVIFWSAAGAIFTLRQGKRLYGLISTGSVLARIVGFLLTPILVPLIGSANLLYASALLLACAWLLITPIMRGHHESQSIQPATSNRSGSTHPTRYIKLIYTIFFVGSITFYLILITFYSVIELRFTDADAIASFLGLFFGVINITILLTKTLVANWFMQRFGITANLLIRPIILFTLAVTLLIVTLTSSTVAPLFFLVLAISFIDNLLYSGLYLPSFVLLFQPLSKSVRIAVQSITQGVVGSVSLGIAGGIILLLGRDRITVNAIILSVMLLMWITALFAIRREYPKALRKALSQRFLTGGELDLSAPEALAVIRQKLASPHPNEVIYALELLQREDSSHAAAVLPQLLTHPEALVRREAIVRTETLCLKSAETTIRQLVQHEPDLLTRAAAVRAVARCASEDAIHDLLPLVAAQEPALQQAALIGLLHSGNLSAARQALDRLHSLAGGNPTERQQVAAVIAQVGTPNLQHLLQPLLTDSRSSVRRATLLAAQHYPALQDNLLAQLTNVHSGTAAQSALVTQGAAVLPKLQQRFAASVDTDEQRALVDVIGRIGTPQTHDWLLAQLANPSGKLRSHTLRALYRLQPAIDEPQRERLKTILVDEAARAAEVVAALNRLRTLAAPQLSRGLSELLDSIRDRILDLLALVYPDAPVAQIRENLRHPLPSQQAYAIELLDVALPPKLKRRVLHVLRPALPSEPVSAVDAPTLLGQLAFEHREPFTEWIQICALYAIGKLGEQRFLPQLDELLSAENRLISETARWSASQLAPSSTHAIGLLTMLLTIEKVIILRSVDLFASTPDETLVQVAGLLDEVTLEAGATIFEKGDMGDSMYIIVNGKVRVHDGEQTLNYLEDRSVFGEMALLDPEPRVASISAETPTLLLKLDQEPFSELLDTRPEVSRGIIRVLSRHLRERVRDLNTLRQ